MLRRYLKAIEDGYGDVNPYHSRLHAADVLQSLHVTLHNGGMVGPESYADDLTLMTCYLAAVSTSHQILVEQGCIAERLWTRGVKPGDGNRPHTFLTQLEVQVLRVGVRFLGEALLPMPCISFWLRSAFHLRTSQRSLQRSQNGLWRDVSRPTCCCFEASSKTILSVVCLLQISSHFPLGAMCSEAWCCATLDGLQLMLCTPPAMMLL